MSLIHLVGINGSIHYGHQLKEPPMDPASRIDELMPQRLLPITSS